MLSGGLYTPENVMEIRKLSLEKGERILSTQGSNFGKEKRGVDGLCIVLKTYSRGSIESTVRLTIT